MHPPTPSAPQELIELWSTLAQLKWTSLMLIPTDPDGSTAEIAKALASIGQLLGSQPVTAVHLNSLEYGSALALVDLQRHARGLETSAAAARAPIIELNSPPPGSDQQDAEPRTGSRASEAIVLSPPTRLVISIPAVIAEPLGISAAREADVVVLAVRMAKTRMDNVRRTIELVGKNRIAGCYLVT
jgi:hypothetical protein